MFQEWKQEIKVNKVIIVQMYVLSKEEKENLFYLEN
jgi:hypothetical protein